MKTDGTLKNVKTLPPVDYLRTILDYDSDSGLLTWKVSKGSASIGSIAGTKHNRGYLCVQINNQSYLVHRIVWCIYYGSWTNKFIDHIDLIKDNNRINNLREATRANNSQNHLVRSDSTSGVKGVTWHKRLSKWQARIQVDNKRIHLGYFSSIQEAEMRIIQHRNNLHKEFSNHG